MYRLLTFLLLFTLGFGGTVYAQETDETNDDATATTTEETDDETATSTDHDPVRRAQEDIDRVRQDVLNQRSRLIDGFQERETERAQTQEERQAQIEERQLEREANAEVRQEERLRVATDRAQMFVERTAERFGAVVARLETLGVRIESRIEKFQERGVDTSEAEALVDSAYAALAEGQETLRVAADTLMTAVLSDTPRENVEAAKALFDDAKEDLRTAHALFVDAVESLKASTTE